MAEELYNQLVAMKRGNSPEKRTLERKIRHMEQEIEAIESALYTAQAGDLHAQVFFTQLRRKNAVRSTVLELHTAIEDLINDWLKARLLGYRQEKFAQAGRKQTARGRILDDLLHAPGALGFEKKVDMLWALGMVRKPICQKLKILNTLRNRCAHNWELNVVMRRKRRPRQQKPPLLEYKDRNLYQLPVILDFMREYSRLYVWLFMNLYA